MTPFLAALPLGIGIVVLAQTDPTAAPSAFVQWGVAGALMAFILWLYIDERKEHRALREKVLTDVLPALIANNEQLKESSAATVMVHQLLARPGLDPRLVNDLTHALRRVERRLDDGGQ